MTSASSGPRRGKRPTTRTPRRNSPASRKSAPASRTGSSRSTSSGHWRSARSSARHGTRKSHPDRLPANYHKLHGVRQFHACYSVGDDTLWGVVRRRKSAANTLTALKSIRAARPDGAPIYVILDNLSAHKGRHIRAWAARNQVELCFTPTYSSWANPIEAHFGPLRTFVVAGSNHPNHTVATRAMHAYLRWRNANARHPDVLAAQRRERARVRSERQRRWGHTARAAA